MSVCLAVALVLAAAVLMFLAAYAHAAPANDNFANAQLLAGLPASATGSNVDATIEVGEPDHNNNAETGHSVWYEWVSPVTGEVGIDLGGSNYDTYLAVYSDPNPVPSLATLSLIDSDDDGGFRATSRLVFDATSGETYWIAVDGFSSSTGSIKLQIYEPGSITGNVTDEFATPLEAICVDLLELSERQVASTQTDSSGDYTLDVLYPDSYKVRFRNCGPANVVSEYYDDKDQFAVADPVVVLEGAETAGINAQLAEGGTMSGTVTDAGGDPLEDICVGTWSDGVDQGGNGQTDSAGEYLIEGLPTANDYVVQFTDCGTNNVVAEFYDDARLYGDASRVSVTQGAETAGVDAELATGGSISGTVVDEQGDPLENVCVDADDPKSGSFIFIAGGGQIGISSGLTDVNGEYELQGGYTGNYLIYFYDCGGNDVISEYYNNEYERRYADRVPVTEGANTPNIDVEMLSPDSPPPDTVIDSGPTGTIRSREATFTFHGTPEARTRKIKCRIDQGTYSDCRSAKTFTGLSDGPHTVEFRAVGYAGNSDPTPASRTFTVEYDPCEAARSDLDRAKKKQKKARKQKNKAERSLKKAKKTGRSSKVKKARKKVKKAKKKLNKANRQVESGRKSVDAKC